MKLTKDIQYNIIYQYKGWEGNFSGIFIEDDSCYSYFKDGNDSIVKVSKYIIISAIPVK